MRTIFIFTLFVSLISAQAANRFVRKGASGANNGTDWNNAWTDFSSVTGLVAGDTVNIAGGTYTTQLRMNWNGSSGSPITFQRVRTTDTAATSAAGWNASFDSQVIMSASISGSKVLWPGGIGNWINISGRIADGWHINFGDNSAGIEMDQAAVSNCRIEYIYSQGPGRITETGDTRAMDLTCVSGTLANITVSHCEMKGGDACLFLASGGGVTGATIEYCTMHDAGAVNAATFHPNVAYMGRITSSTFRYNVSYNIDVEGFFFGDSGNDNIDIYGNVFYEGTSNDSGRGIEFDNAGSGTNFRIYNNTFDLRFGCIRLSGTSHTGSIAKNNLFTAANGTASNGGNIWSSATHDFNGYSSGSADGEANGTAGITSPYANASSGDFRIVTTISSTKPRNRGTALTATYNTDMDGNVRGNDGTWDLGAFEFASGGGVPGTLALTSSAQTVSENVGSVQFNVSRSSGSSGTVGISYSTGNGTAIAPGDYTTTSGTLTWNSGDTADKIITIPIIDDSTVESTESFSLIISSPTGGSTLGSPSTATITITDNDTLPPAISVSPSTAQTFTDTDVNQSRTLTFTVSNTGGGTLSGSVSGLSAPFSIVSGSPYSIGGGGNQVVTIRFAPTVVGTFSQTAAFSGGAGVSRGLTGTGLAVNSTVLNGVAVAGAVSFNP